MSPPQPLTGSGGALQRAMATAAAAAQQSQGRAPLPGTVGGNTPQPFGKMQTGGMAALPSVGQPRAPQPPPPPPASFAPQGSPPARQGSSSRPTPAQPMPAPRANFGGPGPLAQNAQTQAPRGPTSNPVLNPNGPQPVRISADLVMDEFKNLAVMHSQMAERLSAVENALQRLENENQEIRELLARQNQA
jgi:hypothetical protein